MSEMCRTRLAENTGRENYAKNRHLRTIAQLCTAISSQLQHVSTIGKKLFKQQHLLHMSPQYGELRPTKPNSSTLAVSKLVRTWSQTGSKPNSITLSGSSQLRTSFEPAPNQIA